MKIALCFSGAIKDSYKEAWDNIQLNLLNLIPEYDIFCVTSRQTALEKVDFFKNISKSILLEDFMIDNNLYAQKEYVKLFENRYIEWMHYQIFLCNQLKSNYEKIYNFKYDLVFRCRFDAIYSRKLNFDDLMKMRDDRIYFSSYHGVTGYSDLFYGGASNLMDLCSNCVFYIPEQFKLNKRMHAETILKDYLDSLQIQAESSIPLDINDINLMR